MIGGSQRWERREGKRGGLRQDARDFRTALLCQLLQQLLCGAQVVCLEPLGEPAVQLGQDLMGLRIPALPPPQASKRRRCSELQRSGLLLSGNLNGP